jgi:dolichol-phosphate mannosyltransferase
MANEEREFDEFTGELQGVLDEMQSGHVYIVVDKVSVDNTYDMCMFLAATDPRFTVVWAPENRNIVDAYLRGFREAFERGHDFIIEMDAGMSHDPKAIPQFIKVLSQGNDCAFGSRFIGGGSMTDSPLNRRLLSRSGTLLANLFLGTGLYDMTSGFQGFHSAIVGKLLKYPFLSKAHFFQTEVRYLLRNHRFVEIPIHYKAPSPRVSSGAITNALSVLTYYFRQKICRREVRL